MYIKKNLPVKVIDKKENFKLYKDALAQKQSLIKNNFLKTSDGTLFVGLNTALVDNLINQLYQEDKFSSSKESKSSIALIAIGGYGRGELAPHSDIDILFLLSDNNDKLIKVSYSYFNSA